MHIRDDEPYKFVPLGESMFGVNHLSHCIILKKNTVLIRIKLVSKFIDNNMPFPRNRIGKNKNVKKKIVNLRCR